MARDKTDNDNGPARKKRQTDTVTNTLTDTAIHDIVYDIVIASIMAVSLIAIFAANAAQTSALTWSEILFNPEGDDNNKEFIELIIGEGENISLENCTIRDSASSDALTLLRGANAGNRYILIVEDESEHIDRQSTQDSAIYTAGSAIGNGLGNTYETLTIMCGAQALLHTSYNTSDIAGYADGRSIAIVDGAWTPGTNGGTPGVGESARNVSADGNETGENGTSSESDSPPPTSGADAERNGDDAGGAACNESLQLLLGATKAPEGAQVSFLLLSPGYASFEARNAEGAVFAAGDNLRGARHSLIALNTSSIRLSAWGVVCGAHQRMIRTITVERDRMANDTAMAPIALKDAAPPEPLAAPPPQTDMDAGDTIATMDGTDGADDNGTVKTDGNGMTGDVAGAARTKALQDADSAQDTRIMPTGAIVLDKNGVAVPAIALFGTITVIVSAIVFLRVSRTERESGEQSDNETGETRNT